VSTERQEDLPPEQSGQVERVLEIGSSKSATTAGREPCLYKNQHFVIERLNNTFRQDGPGYPQVHGSVRTGRPREQVILQVGYYDWYDHTEALLLFRRLTTAS